ncbi:MAG: AraC family transcriptional regulator [Turicibacter sp.]
MQKQLNFKNNIYFQDIQLSDEFPIQHYLFEQKHHDLNFLHYHDIFEIGICLEGSGLFFINNQVLTFSKGDVSFIFPNHPHIAQSPNEMPSIWVFISLDLNRLFPDQPLLINELLLNQYDLPHLLTSNHDEDLAQLIRIVIHELERNHLHNDQVIKQLLCAFFIKLLRLENSTLTHPTTLSHAFISISPALNHISSHYCEEISIDELAKICSLSPTHFRVTFKKATNISPLHYLTSIRMKMAKTLLKSTKLSILTISEKVGYQTISSFNRTFKEQFQMTPTQYRSMIE